MEYDGDAQNNTLETDADVNMMDLIKSESADKNIRVYILAVISMSIKNLSRSVKIFYNFKFFIVAMVAYATYLVYKSEKIKKMIEIGADKIK